MDIKIDVFFDADEITLTTDLTEIVFELDQNGAAFLDHDPIKIQKNAQKPNELSIQITLKKAIKNGRLNVTAKNRDAIKSVSPGQVPKYLKDNKFQVANLNLFFTESIQKIGQIAKPA